MTGEGGAVQEAVSSDDGVSTVVVESVTRHIGVLLQNDRRRYHGDGTVRSSVSCVTLTDAWNKDQKYKSVQGQWSVKTIQG